MLEASQWDNDPTAKARSLLALPAFVTSKALSAVTGSKDYAADDLKKGWNNASLLSNDDTAALAARMAGGSTLNAISAVNKTESVGGWRGQFGQLFDGEMSDADKGLHEVSGSTKGQSPEEMFAENSAALTKSTEAIGTLTTAVDTFANKLPEVLKFGRDGRPILPDK